MQCLKSGVDNPGGSINTARPVPPPCSGAFFSGVFFFFPRCADGYVYDSCSRTHFVNIKKKLAKMRALPVRFRIVGRTVACVGISLFILRLRNTVQLALEDRAGCVRWLCATSLLATGGGFSARRWPSTGVFQEPCHVHKCASALENVAHFACGNRVPHVVRRVVRPDLEQFTRAVLERSSRCSRSGLFDVGTNGRMGDRGPHGWDDE